MFVPIKKGLCKGRFLFNQFDKRAKFFLVEKQFNEHAHGIRHACRNVRFTDILKISVLNSISVYWYDFFCYTRPDTPKFTIDRNVSV